ncbi:MAG: metallophosphoesterase [Clostridiales bacterium]|nr:metallophosphoesterase [Clostridiales bacterium]
MKVLKLLMAALVSSLGISLFTACGGAKGTGKPSASSLGKIENDEPPILRFIVASDVHIKDSGDEVERQRLAKLFTRSYQLFSNSSYSKIDAVCFAGDISDKGTTESLKAFKEICDQNIKEGTTLFTVLGNHEFFTDPGKTVNRYEEALETTEDVHITLNGIHFIGLSPSGGTGYSQQKRDWLDAQIQQAVKEDREKPVFVFQHHHVTDTVYGSGAPWGIDDLKDVLSKYPQVIDFSGHSHFPLNDPRSIWQGAFTALGTSTLSYFELELNGEYGQFPDGYTNAAQMYIVEVNKKGGVQIRCYDLIVEQYIGEIYTIEQPWNPDSFQYTTAKRLEDAGTPAFENQAKAVVKETEEFTYHLEFPAAKDSQIVHHYNIAVKDETGKTVFKKSLLSGYYCMPNPKMYEVPLNGLEYGAKYIAEITAVNAYDKKSEPLTVDFTTKEIENDPSVTVPEADLFDMVIENDTIRDQSAQKHLITKIGEPEILENDNIQSTTLYFNGGTDDYFRVEKFGDSYPVLQKGFTFEAYFSVETFPGNGYGNNISNMENGGFGFEMYPDNQVTFSMYVGGEYVFVTAEAEEERFYHYVVTYDGDTLKLYQDGALQDELECGSELMFTTVPDAQFLCIGADSTKGGLAQTGLPGEIALVRIYSSVMDSRQVNKLNLMVKHID